MVVMPRWARVPAALVLASTLVLGACAPGSPTEEQPEQPAGPVDPASFQGKTLNYLYFTDGPDEDVTRELIASFEEEYGVTVNLEVLPFSEIQTSLQARISGGNVPHVARVASIRPFEDVAVDMSTYFGAEYAQEFLPATLAGVRGAEGEMLGVPSDLTMNGPFINTALFEEAGVEFPGVGEEWTWQEMVDAAKEVQQATGTEYAYALDKSGHRLSTVLSEGGTYTVSGGQAVLDPDKATAALEPLATLFAEEAAPTDFWLGSGTRYEGANDIFLSEQVPVYLSGNWQVAQFAQTDLEWTAAPNPCAAECGGFPGGKFTLALEGSEDPALGAFFVQHLNTAEAQQAYATGANFLPTRVDLSEQGVSYETRQEAMDVFLADVALTPESAYDAVYDPNFDGAATALVENFSAAVAGQVPLAEAMTTLRADLDELVGG